MRKILTWLFRVLTGATFIYSGFVKGIDPWGTLYKFEEYMEALGLPNAPYLLTAAVFALCTFEFLLGVMLLLACYRRSAPIAAIAFMAVMLPLTLWIALSNPVADCGCFGDAFVISNWATFWKNVVLTLMIAWLIKFNRGALTIISPAFQWIGVVISLCYILIVAFVGFKWQPLIDFRPYHAGTPLFAANDSDDYDSDFIFIYEKDGEKKEFGIDDDLPDESDGWTFVERRENSVRSTPESQKTFRAWDRTGNEDLSDELSTPDGQELLMMVPDLGDVSPATTWKINAIYDWCARNDVQMAAVVFGSPREIADWQDLAMPRYDIYTADDTAIKEVARGNPAIVMMRNDTIMWKTALSTLEVEDSETDSISVTPSSLVTQPAKSLSRITWIYIICMIFPIALSFLPRIRFKHKKPTR